MKLATMKLSVCAALATISIPFVVSQDTCPPTVTTTEYSRPSTTATTSSISSLSGVHQQHTRSSGMITVTTWTTTTRSSAIDSDTDNFGSLLRRVEGVTTAPGLPLFCPDAATVTTYVTYGDSAGGVPAGTGPSVQGTSVLSSSSSSSGTSPLAETAPLESTLGTSQAEGSATGTTAKTRISGAETSTLVSAGTQTSVTETSPPETSALGTETTTGSLQSTIALSSDTTTSSTGSTTSTSDATTVPITVQGSKTSQGTNIQTSLVSSVLGASQTGSITTSSLGETVAGTEQSTRSHGVPRPHRNSTTSTSSTTAPSISGTTSSTRVLSHGSHIRTNTHSTTTSAIPASTGLTSGPPSTTLLSNSRSSTHGSALTDSTAGSAQTSIASGLQSTISNLPDQASAGQNLTILPVSDLWMTVSPTPTSCSDPNDCWITPPVSTLRRETTISFPGYSTSVCLEACGTVWKSTTIIQPSPETYSTISYMPVAQPTGRETDQITAMPLLGPQSSSFMVPGPWSTCRPHHQTTASDGVCGPSNNYLCPKKQCCGPTGHCGTGDDHCGKGCQINYGDCFKRDHDGGCKIPPKSTSTPVPIFILWGRGRGGGGLDWPPIPKVPKIPKIPKIFGCNPLLRLLHLCKPGGLCDIWGCEGPGGSWCLTDCHEGGHDDNGGVDGDGELCDQNMENCEPPSPSAIASSTAPNCETTYSATDLSKYCGSATFTQVSNTRLAPPNTCTHTRSSTREACEPIEPSTTTLCDHCSTTATATDYTSYCLVANRTISSNGQPMTITPFTTCTSTTSSKVSGCGIIATSTAIIDHGNNTCPFLGPNAPTIDDDQGEDGNMTSTNSSCPYSSIIVSPLSDQGEDGVPEAENSTCPLANITCTPVPDLSTTSSTTSTTSSAPVTCNGVVEYLTALSSEANSMLNQGSSLMSQLHFAEAQTTAAPLPSAVCNFSSWQAWNQSVSRLEACPHVTDELEEYDWGKADMSAFADMRSNYSSFASVASQKLCNTTSSSRGVSIIASILGHLTGFSTTTSSVTSSSTTSQCSPPTNLALPSCTKVVAPKAAPSQLGRRGTSLFHLSDVSDASYSCVCGTTTNYGQFPTLTGENCGTTQFCMNQIGAVTTQTSGPKITNPPLQMSSLAPNPSLTDGGAAPGKCLEQCSIPSLTQAQECNSIVGFTGSVCHEQSALQGAVCEPAVNEASTGCNCAYSTTALGSTTQAAFGTDALTICGNLVCPNQQTCITTHGQLCIPTATDHGSCTLWSVYEPGHGDQAASWDASCICDATTSVECSAMHETCANVFSAVTLSPSTLCGTTAACPNQVAIFHVTPTGYGTTATIEVSPSRQNMASTSGTCTPPTNTAFGSCTLSYVVPTGTATVNTWCECDNQGTYVVEPTAICGTPMCPNQAMVTSMIMSTQSLTKRFEKRFGFQPDESAGTASASYSTAYTTATTPPIPGSMPSSPAKDTQTPMRPTAIARSIVVDDDGTAYEVIDGTETIPLLHPQSHHQSPPRHAKSDGSKQDTRSHFLPGPPRWLRNGADSAKSENESVEARQKVMIVEIRQMLSSASDIHKAAFTKRQAGQK